MLWRHTNTLHFCFCSAEWGAQISKVTQVHSPWSPWYQEGSHYFPNWGTWGEGRCVLRLSATGAKCLFNIVNLLDSKCLSFLVGRNGSFICSIVPVITPCCSIMHENMHVGRVCMQRVLCCVWMHTMSYVYRFFRKYNVSDTSGSHQ